MSGENYGKDKKVVVAGDVAIDVLEEIVPAKKENNNWESYRGIKTYKRGGGALLLADLVKNATGLEVSTHEVKDIDNTSPQEHIHSYCTISRFGDESLRISESRGFNGPAPDELKYTAIKDDNKDAKLVIIDDAGNGFDDSKGSWPAAIDKNRNPYVIYKMSYPLMSGKLWEKMVENHLEKLVVVISADDLRKSGVKISRRLSWERTAQELIWQMTSNAKLLPLQNAAWVIIRFGADGVILFRNKNGEPVNKLFFDPNVGENSFAELHPGRMQGLNSAFVAALSKSIITNGFDELETGIQHAMASARCFWKAGFLLDKVSGEPIYPGKSIFKEAEEDVCKIAVTDIKRPRVGDKGESNWCILDDVKKSGFEKVASELVLYGKSDALSKVPLGIFKYLQTYDRSEIESFSSIKNLIKEYLETPSDKKPISFAVFGAPGSGKSFGVEQVAESIAPDKIKTVEFNMSQFSSPEELISALHKVRDISLGQKLPLVFFDEFDTEFGRKLGWLKYFLAPMQDGKFKEGDTVHPIGRAIFVFAGGTCHNFKDFSNEEKFDEENKSSTLTFKGVKGPDFVSRLKGFIDIKGPNPVPGTEDAVYIIRRAAVLRNLLLRSAKNIVDGKKIRMDKDLLRAFLKVSKFKHGIRSIESIVKMSLTAGKDRFEQSSLPSPQQLDIHVDSEEFLNYVTSDAILGDKLADIAKMIHENYRAFRKKIAEEKIKIGKKTQADVDKEFEDDLSMVAWEELTEDLKESNYDQARNIKAKIAAINCDFAPVLPSNEEEDKAEFTFDDEEIEALAKNEHERWVQERKASGWKLGPKNNKDRKTPFLVTWGEMINIPVDHLPEDIETEKDKKAYIKEIMDFDRNAVCNIPEYLQAAGFEIYRLDK